MCETCDELADRQNNLALHLMAQLKPSRVNMCFIPISTKRPTSSSSIWCNDPSRYIQRIRTDYVAFWVHVTRFKSKEVGIMKLQDAFIFLCSDGSRKSSNLTPPSSRRRAQGVTLCKEEDGVAEVSETDRDAVEAREDVWIYLSPPHYAQNNCMYRKGHHFLSLSSLLTS